MKKMSVQYSTNQSASPLDEGKAFGSAIPFSLEEMSQNNAELEWLLQGIFKYITVALVSN